MANEKVKADVDKKVKVSTKKASGRIIICFLIIGFLMNYFLKKYSILAGNSVYVLGILFALFYSKKLMDKIEKYYREKYENAFKDI